MNSKSSFHGSSSPLRVFAGVAVGALMAGWVSFAFGWAGAGLACQLTAFVLGLSSCCPLGGLASLGSVLTLIGWLGWGAMMSAS